MSIQLQLLTKKIPLSLPRVPISLRQLRPVLQPVYELYYSGDPQQVIKSFYDNIPFERELRVVLLKDNKFQHEFTINPSENFKNIVPQLYEDNESERDFLADVYDADKILIFRPQQLEGRNLQQTFRDSPNTICVFESILKKFDELP